MVSLWPWKGDDSSPAAFEKTLSSLSSKIGQASSNLESIRQRGRRLKALWTLYTSFAYLLYLMIAGLVVGWQNWGPVELTAVSSAPVLIYVVRLALSSYYDYRASNQQAHLKSLQKQRDVTISKLKEATKYNTTQQLLDKYGGTPQKPATSSKKEKGPSPQRVQQTQKRRETTGFVPPPTANIPGRRVASAALASNIQAPSLKETGPESYERSDTITPPNWPHSEAPSTSAGAEFAPNAFNEPRLYAANSEGSSWYDRLMDVVLGEDESSPKNRLALICHECRLVNGQAPPGVKTLEEVGKWRCSACGTMNGEDTATKKLVADLTGQVESAPTSPADAQMSGQKEIASDDLSENSDHTVYSEDERKVPEASEKIQATKRRPKAQT